MKYAKVFVVIALTSTIMVSAQQQRHSWGKGKYHKEFTVEQLATLKTKKMTLALDLSEKQQREVMTLHMAEVEYRKTKMEERQAKKESGELKKPTAEERYAMQNAKLDRMIAQQKQLKEILSNEQYDQWKKMQLYRHSQQKQKSRKECRRG